MKRASRMIPVVLSILLLSSPHLNAGGRRRAVAVSLPSSELSITFIDRVLDAGTMSWTGERRRSSLARRAISMRVGPPSREARGTVTLRAFLETDDGRATIRVNGVTLSSIPQIVERHAPIGVVFTQRVEIEVATTEPEGPLAAAIGWEVITD